MQTAKIIDVRVERTDYGKVRASVPEIERLSKLAAK